MFYLYPVEVNIFMIETLTSCQDNTSGRNIKFVRSLPTNGVSKTSILCIIFPQLQIEEPYLLLSYNNK